MRVFREGRTILAAMVLLLVLAVVPGASMSAQSANPVPWPTPAAIPPPPPIVPDRHGVPTGFDETGQIQFMSLDAAPGLCNKDDNPFPTPTNPPLPDQCKTTGGWIQLNNDLIRVPQNVVVIFPNTLITWEEAFEFNPNVHQTDAVIQSGLAMADTVRFPGTYQGHVQGNIINGQYVAGLVFIFQDPANQMQGFIESIDYPNGVLVVNGHRVQINDPKINEPTGLVVLNPDGSAATDASGNPIVYHKGRYSAGQSADPRFAVDQNNTTVRAQTGYPMCIPVVAPGTWQGSDGVPDPYVTVPGVANPLDDPQCPEINRPRNNVAGVLSLQNIFTMNAPGAPPSPDNPFPQDPYLEAPFEVGDFVTVIGTQEVDPATNIPFITATQVLNTSVGAYTWPNTDPAYPVVEVVIQGTAGVASPFFPQEAGVRTRVEGFTTDPLRTVDVSAIDIDCNGNLTFREPSWTANFPVEPGPPGIGVKGRWRMRFPQGGDFLPAVENVGVRVSGSSPGKNKNGLTYSEYQLPSGEFIFPENLVPGTPPPASNFADILYLDNGLGPMPMVSDVFDSTQIQLGQQPRPFFPNQQLGQLNPFPGDTIPPLTCFPGTSTSQAVAKFNSTPNPPYAGITVTLDGTGSTPPTGPFTWKQVLNPGDPQVVINNANSALATFIAPYVSGPQNLTFSLVVGGGSSAVPQSAPATLIVPIVVPPPNTAPVITAATATGLDAFNPPPATVTGNLISVSSASPVTLNAVAVDPANGTLTYTWTQIASTLAPPGPGGQPGQIDGGSVTLTQVAADGSVMSFNAPTVPVLTPVMVFTFQVTATSSASGLISAPATVVVMVVPESDRIVISNVVYRRTKGRLIVNVSDFTPGVTLTCTLDIINPATGLQWSGVMGPIIPFAQGVYSIRFSNIPPPNLVTITSSAGGTASSGVTALR